MSYSLGVILLFTFAIMIAGVVAGVIAGLLGAVGAFLSGMNHPDLPPFSFGYVNLLAFIILVPITGFMAPYGAKMAHTIKPRHLKLAFVAFLLFNSANMIISAL